MYEIKEEDLELIQLLRKVDTLIEKGKKAVGKENISIVEECDRYITQCKNIMSRIEIETRDMDTDDRASVRSMLKERASQLKELNKEFKWLKNDNKKTNNNVLEYDMNNPLKNIDQFNNLEEMNEDQVISYAKALQNDDISRLDQVIVDTEQTKKMAEDTAAAAKDQTNQILRIGNRMDEIDDELERAKRILKIMMRRLMTDKIIWVMVGLIVIALIFIVASNFI